MKSPPLLILASTSVYRRELLERTRIPFDCMAPGVDETRHAGEAARALVARLALEKATAIAVRHPDACVVGSDQVAVLHGGNRQESILGKPGTIEKCREQLAACSSQMLEFVTGVAIVRQAAGLQVEFIDTTRVQFRTLDPASIERYVAREAPLDCAGGFKCEGLGITLCEAIDSSDPTALIGLPLIRLCAVLRTAGFELP